MEMHQVRYFLAVARALNFTRGAEECNVAQPSLTRAIRQLEEEFGGDLFRRERPHAQLTELGQRMVPLLQQCYDSALGARLLASSIKTGEVGALRVALSHTIDLAILLPHIVELRKHFKHLELKLLRGTAAETAEFLKEGRAELAIASSLGDAWERLDRWPLYTETFHLVANKRHPLAGRKAVAFEDLRDEPILVRAYCEHAEPLAELSRNHYLNIDHAHELSSQHDLVVLLEQGFRHYIRSPQRASLRKFHAHGGQRPRPAANHIYLRGGRPAAYPARHLDHEELTRRGLVAILELAKYFGVKQRVTLRSSCVCDSLDR